MKTLKLLTLLSLISCVQKNADLNTTNKNILMGSNLSSQSAPKHGVISLALTDAPKPDISEVWINIDHIEIKTSGANGDEDLTFAQSIGMVDLLSLQNGKTMDLGDMNFPEGTKINQVRLVLKEQDNHIIYPSGERCDLQTPSQQQSGLKLISPKFEVQDGKQYNMVIDFDAMKSVVIQGNGSCLLKPVLKWASFNVADMQKPEEEFIDQEGPSQEPEEEVVEQEQPSQEDEIIVEDKQPPQDDQAEEVIVDTEQPEQEQPAGEVVVEEPTPQEDTTVVTSPLSGENPQAPEEEVVTTDEPQVNDPVTTEPDTREPASEEPIIVVDNPDINGADLAICDTVDFDLYDESTWPADFVYEDYQQCY